MPVPHVLLEIRTSQDNQKTAEAAAQLFSTFPKLRDKWWWKLIRKNEHLSFELVVNNQTVYFQVYAPYRLSEYLKGAISANYPEALIAELEVDPLDALFSKDLESSPTHISV